MHTSRRPAHRLPFPPVPLLYNLQKALLRNGETAIHMRLRTKLTAAALLAALLFALATAARFLELGGELLSLEALRENAARLLNRPYFHIGELAITPVFLFKALLFVLLLALSARAVRMALRRHLLDRTALDEGQKYNIGRLTQYLIFFLGLIVGLESIGVSLASLAVFGGALGIGIGFGLQDTANNFIAGLILLFERPVKVGDRIEVGGLDGQVVRIGARSTWVRTNDNIVIVLPNSEFIAKPVINWTANDRRVRFLVPVGVSYSSDPEIVRRVLLEVAAENQDVLAEPAPDVIFTGFGDSALNLELRVWTTTQVHRRPIIRSDLYFAIFRAFRQHGIQIPFPQRDLHIKSVDVGIPVHPQPQ